MSSPVEVQKYLSGIDYPVDRGALVEHAESQGADEGVVEQLRGLPDRQYNGPDAVSQELSGS